MTSKSQQKSLRSWISLTTIQELILAERICNQRVNSKKTMKLYKTCGMAVLTVVLSAGSSAYSSPVSLFTLVLGGGTITSGDLTFSGFSNLNQASGSFGGLNIDPNSIYVVAVGGGIEFYSSLWSMSGTSFAYSLSVDYDVTTTDGSFIDQLASTISGNYSAQGQARLNDAVSNGGSLGTASVNIDSGYSSLSTPSSAVSFAAQTTVSVAKTLVMQTGGSGGTIAVNNFSDTFTTTVPEPSSIALLGSFGGLGLFLLRRRR